MEPRHPKVLLVDRDDEARAVLEYWLTREGFTVETCASPAEALSRLHATRRAKAPFHALVATSTVLLRPGSNFLKALRSANPELKALVIAAGPWHVLAKKLRALGIALLRKPFDLETLTYTLHRLLQATASYSDLHAP